MYKASNGSGELMENKVIRVGGYIRVSTQEQAKEGYSIPAQTKCLKSYCSARNWILHELYIDPGYSGAKMERPALQKMLSDIKKGFVDLVLVYKLDRLSRSQKDTLYLIEDVFLKNEVAFVSINENFDTSSAFGRAMIGILSVFAQLEREQIKERTQMGLAERAKNGMWHGSGITPIGYDYDPASNQLIVNEYEAMQIREAFDLFVNQNYAFTKIVKTFRNKGYSHKHGVWVHSSKLRYILSNKTYIGRINWNGEDYPGKHDPIIPNSLFEAAQKKLAEKDWKLTDKPAKSPFDATQLLSGVLFCGNCGGRYYGAGCYRGSHDPNSPKRRYEHIYSCYSRTKTKLEMIKDPSCKNKNWKTETLDNYVITRVKNLRLEGEIENLIVKERPKNPGIDRRKALEKQIDDIDRQISRLLTLYQLEDVPTAEIGLRLSDLTRKKKTVEEAIENIPLYEPELSVAKAKSLLADAEEIFNCGTTEEKRSLIHALIRKIILTGNDVVIEWAFI